MKKYLLHSFLITLLILPAFLHAGQTLVIAGTGDSQSLLRFLAKDYMQANPDVVIEVPDSFGSGGGIKLLQKDKVIMARTARPLKNKEQAGLVETPIAKSPVVFVVHHSVSGLESISTDQIVDIYSGRIRDWSALGLPEHKLYVVDREGGDSSRAVVEKYLPAFAEIKSVGKIIYTTPETADALVKNDYTIGYLPLSEALGRGLHILAVDQRNHEHADYPFMNTFYLVTKDGAKGLPSRFIEYLGSPSAKAIMRQHGVIPVLP